MNNTTTEKLQLNEVKDKIKEYCVSSLGKELIDKLIPSKNIKIVKRKLKENIEAKKVLENSNHIPLEGLFNIIPIIDKIEKGMILEPNELIRIEDFLRGCKKIKSFMIDKEFYSPTLSSYALNITLCENIEHEINHCIKNNKVDSQASKELKKLRRNIEVAEGKIKERLNKFITSSTNKKYIQEFIISKRDDRYVVPIKASYKNEVDGVVLDTSSKGNTVFIEPRSVSKLSFIISKRDDRYVVPIKASYKNEVDGVVLDTSSKGNTVFIEPRSVSKLSLELISLKSEESIEEYKILSYLTELIFEKIPEIKLNIEVIGEYDMVFAKAKYSQNINGITPKINDNGYINIVNGKHPLLKGNVVALNFEIGNTYRSLVITGPNAGGKTISLKTVGILTLMVQCGH